MDCFLPVLRVQGLNPDQSAIGMRAQLFVSTKLSLQNRKGGPLAVTDANLMLGRLIPDYFPKIFGKTEKEPLDTEASKQAFEKLTEQINSEHETKLSLDEVVYG